MSCGDDFKALLSRYVDAELSLEERATVEDHLLSCEPCRELLSLFQKNENLVASALSTDAFGDAVVESVIRRIELDTPPEAKPVEDGPIEWFRARPWIPAAAAALLVALIAVFFSVSQSNELATVRTALQKSVLRVDSLAEKNRRSESELQDQLRQAVTVQEELGRLERDWKTHRALERAPEGAILGYIESEHYLVAKASFGGSSTAGFNVFRRLEGEREDSAWKKLNADLLQTPEFVDRTVRPGQGYVYKFQALRSSGDAAESVPLIMKVPFAGDFSPEKSIWIHCQDLAAPKDLAVFVLDRVVNGRTVSAKFYTELGKPVGGKAVVDGAEIDFTTDLVLARIETGTQPLVTSYTTPVLDKDGNPIMEQVVGNVFIPATQRSEVSFNQRENKRAVLRLAGTTGSKSEEFLWRGSRMQVRAHGE